MRGRSDQGVTPSKPPLWNDPRIRSLAIQIIVIIAVIMFFAYIINNTLDNLTRRGIATGFEFLSNEAGFGIIQTLIEYDEAHTFGRTFLVGLLNTILVSALGILLATLLGFTIGVARLSSNWLIAKMATVYIEVFRNIPLLLQILFWYFAVLQALPGPRHSLSLGEMIFLNVRGLYLPAPIFEHGFWLVPAALVIAVVAVVLLSRWAHRRQTLTGKSFHTIYAAITILVGLPLLAFSLMGFPLSWDLPALKGFNFQGGLTIIPELAALLLALSVYTAAFIAEIVRSGIQAVNRGQTEAAFTLGLSSTMTLRLIVIPQAMRVIIPQLTNQYLNLTKNSSLATAVGYPDLVAVFAGTTLNQTGQAVEVITMTMAVYLTISLVISLLMNLYNKKMALVER